MPIATACPAASRSDRELAHQGVTLPEDEADEQHWHSRHRLLVEQGSLGAGVPVSLGKRRQLCSPGLTCTPNKTKGQGSLNRASNQGNSVTCEVLEALLAIA